MLERVRDSGESNVNKVSGLQSHWTKLLKGVREKVRKYYDIWIWDFEGVQLLVMAISRGITMWLSGWGRIRGQDHWSGKGCGAFGMGEGAFAWMFESLILVRVSDLGISKWLQQGNSWHGLMARTSKLECSRVEGEEYSGKDSTYLQVL